MNISASSSLTALPFIALFSALPRAVEGGEANDFLATTQQRPTFGWVLDLKTELSEIVHISGSVFRMGSTPDEVVQAFADCTSEPLGQLCRVELFSDETPQRTISLSSYWLDRYEVSVGQYARCVQVGRCDPLPYFRGALRFMKESLPATLVTWEEAQTYCSFRNARLPTEAEFERAARGLQGRRYPWGNLYNARASNHGRLAFDRSDASDGFTELAPVGSYGDAASTSGLFDIAGNAEEWVYDRYSYGYDPKDVRDPRGPSAMASGNQRVVRGGSYESPRAWLRSASRDGAEPGERRAERGFRCARSRPKRPADARPPQ